MPKLEISLTNDDEAFIRQNVDAGRFDGASELLHVALSLFREDERDDAAKLERLRRLAKIGFDALDRGEFTTIEPGGTRAFLDEIIAEQRVREASPR